jgi:methyl acetate hydrolase
VGSELPDQPGAVADRPLRGQSGLGGLANSYYWIDPTRKVAGVYAAQVLPFFDEKAARAFAGFETAVYQAL